MTAPAIDTLGLCALVKALEQFCECEEGGKHEECREPLNRWWRLCIADRDSLGDRYAPDARRSA
jgi:hypothetical protein